MLSCPFFPSHLLRCLYRFFYSFLLFPLAAKHSIMARFGSGVWLKCACVCWCGKKGAKYWFDLLKMKLVRLWIQPLWKEQAIIMSPHILIWEYFFSPFLPFVLPSTPPFSPPPLPPSHIHFTKRPTSFYHCGFENRQGEKCLKVLGIQLFQSMNLGRSLKSVLPFIVPCGKICAAKVRRVRQPMTCRLRSARHRLTSERKRDPGLSLREAVR